MGRKRDKPTQQPAEEDIESSDASDDSESAITFNPMTKEERKKQEEQMHEANSEEESDEGDEDGDEDVVNVEFEFSDPKEAHFKSVRNFFRYLFMGSAKEIDFSPLAEAVVGQVEAGSMVQVSGEDDVYAFLTMLNIQYYKNNQNIKDILSLLRKNCPDALKEKFELVLSKQTGLLLNERMRNFPPEVMPHLFESLGEDLKWALENSDTKDAFRYEYILTIAPCFYEKTEKQKKGKKVKLNESGTCLFFHFEDEILKRYADLSFSFDVAQLGDESLSESLHQSRLVMVIPFSKYPQIVKDIQTLVSEFSLCCHQTHH